MLISVSNLLHSPYPSSPSSSHLLDRAAVVDLDPASGFNVSTASDWCVIQLGAVCGRVCELRVDTKHFKVGERACQEYRNAKLLQVVCCLQF